MLLRSVAAAGVVHFGEFATVIAHSAVAKAASVAHFDLVAEQAAGFAATNQAVAISALAVKGRRYLAEKNGFAEILGTPPPFSAPSVACRT